MNQFEAIFLDPISGAVAATARWNDSFDELVIILASGLLPTLRPFSAIEGEGLGAPTANGQLNIRADRSSGPPIFHIELAGRTLIRQTTPTDTRRATSLVWTQPSPTFAQPAAPNASIPPFAAFAPSPPFAPSTPFASSTPFAHGPITYASLPNAQKSSTKKYAIIAIASTVAVALVVGIAGLAVRSRNRNRKITAQNSSATPNKQPPLSLPKLGSLPLQTVDERLFDVVNEYVGAINPEAVAACVKQTYRQVSLSDLDYPEGVPLLNRAFFRCAPAESAKQVEPNIVMSGISDADRTCAAQGLVKGMGDLSVAEFQAVAGFTNTKLFPIDIKQRLIATIETQCIFMEPEMAARVINE